MLKLAKRMFETEKAKTFIIIYILTLLLIGTICLSSCNVNAESVQCKISGYVLDSNGQGVASANVIFNAQATIPGVKTDSTGYYQTAGPAGTYHLDVWPPFDSSYISYCERGFSYSSDIVKNITLATGYKVSGYITLASSAYPVVGACVFLNGSGSGWFSTTLGYYFAVVPAGTYTINAHPRTDSYSSNATNFQEYYEYNFSVNCNTIKNLMVNGTTPTPTPTGGPTTAPDPNVKYKISGYITDSAGKGLSNAEVIFNVPAVVPAVYSDPTGYYEISATAGTYHVNVWPPFDSHYLAYDQPQLIVSANIAKNITLTTGYKVYGYISDNSGNPVSKAIVILSGQTSGWFSKSDGYYALTVPAGTYKIDVHPGTDSNKNPLANFPTYYEFNFTVTSDTLKNIIVGTSAASPTPIPIASPTPKNAISVIPPTPIPTIQSTNPSIPFQNNVKTPAPTFAFSLPSNQSNDNSLQTWILLTAITLVSIVALMTLNWVYRGKQAVIEASR
jgi:hypothetical protein